MKTNVAGLLGRRNQQHRPPCPVKKRDNAKYSLSFSGVVITACLRLE